MQLRRRTPASRAVARVGILLATINSLATAHTSPELEHDLFDKYQYHGKADMWQAGPAAQARCQWLADNFAAQSSQPINNTFAYYYPEGSNPSLELLVATYPNGTLPPSFLPDLKKTLSDVGPDIDISADEGYGLGNRRTTNHGPLGSLPAFCRFGGSLPTSDLTAVLFEVWLPLASNDSIPLAPVNATDYPTDSTPVELAPDLSIIKGPPYLLQMQADGTLPPPSGPVSNSSSPKTTTTAVRSTRASTIRRAPLEQATVAIEGPVERSCRRAHDIPWTPPPLSGREVLGLPRSYDGWNGRLLYIGNGGQRGFVPFTDLKSALLRHRFAVAGSNAGHFSTTGGTAWALGPQVNETTRDWSSRAVHVARTASLEVIDLFYGSEAGVRVRDKASPLQSSQKDSRLLAYYAGCSVGGMQGFGSVQNYPEDFDGLLVGAPAIYFNRVNHGQIHTQSRHRKKVAGDGFFNVSLLLGPVKELILSQCDALDGLADGVINLAAQCNIDLDPLACGANSTYGQDTSKCFTPAQLDNLKELFNETRYNGTFVYDRYYPGLDISATAWSGSAAKAIGWITNAILQNKTAPGFDGYTGQTLDIFERGQEANPGGSNLENADISAFLQGGKRKLIHYHGLGDLTISPAASIRYHDEVSQAVGREAQALAESYRLFSVPGMSHCRNGPGPWHFGGLTQNDAGNRPLVWDTRHDILLSLVAWTEHGERYAPAYQVGASYASRSRFIPSNPATDTGSGSGASDTAALPTTYSSKSWGVRHTRKLCPWPQVAFYVDGPTEGEDAWRSFECRVPT